MVRRQEVQKSEIALVGMGEIATYLGRSPTTVQKLIREMRFPARKIMGKWESDKEAVDAWRKAQILKSA